MRTGLHEADSQPWVFSPRRSRKTPTCSQPVCRLAGRPNPLFHAAMCRLITTPTTTPTTTSIPTTATTVVAWAVVMGLGCGAAVAARAAPPVAHDPARVSHPESHLSVLQPAAPPAALRSAAGAQSPRDGVGPLDLRPPATLNVTQARSKASALPLRDLDEGSYQSRVAALAGLHLPMHESSALRELGRRVGREGLPIARLFESRSALLSLGLSPRGKPGLWLIQKTH